MNVKEIQKRCVEKRNNDPERAEKHRKYMKEAVKKWQKANPDKVKEYLKISQERLKNDPERQERYKEKNKKYRKYRKYKKRTLSKEQLEKKKINLKQRRLKNPELFHTKDRKKALKQKYGISVEMYNNLYENQKGLCKICLKPKRIKDRYLHIDHCHKTGKIRGLLCRSCNLALGLINDDITILDKMKEYLKNCSL